MMKTPNDSTETIPQRVRRTLQDLTVIRQALQTPGITTAPALLDADLATELKCVVDVLRQLLWAYMQALSAPSERGHEEILEWYKMEIAVAMLRTVRSRKASNPEEAGRFEQLMSNALDITAMHSNETEKPSTRAKF
jgi:hypothetical protein